jgi:hypothetical protein
VYSLKGCHESFLVVPVIREEGQKLKFENCYDFEGVSLGLSVSESDDGIESPRGGVLSIGSLKEREGGC